MSLLSFFRKDKQEAASTSGEFHSRAEEESDAVRTRGKRKSKASDETADPLLPEKKRARRRLIGAVALVLAAVIGLPMIFDSEPKPLADDVDIQIPSKDKVAQSSIHRITPASSAASVAASAALDQSEQIVEPAATAAETSNKLTSANKQASAKVVDKQETKVEASATKAPEAKPIATKPVETKTVESKPAEAKASPKKEDVKVALHSGDEERARAILEGRDASKSAADKKGGKFAVQVAALRTQEKINELRNKLKDAGIETYTQKVSIEGGESTRIRVGPFTTKEEADKMSMKLRKLGFNGTVIPPSS